MTKKDYCLTAAVMEKNCPLDPDRQAEWLSLVNALADAYAKDNAAFKRSKFLVACGLED